MIRILHSVSNMDRAGIETMLMNYYRYMDKSKVQFDFLCNKKKPGAYDDEIKSMGGRIYHTPGLNPAKYPVYLKYMRELFQEHPEYKIVEAHNGALGVYALHAAKVSKIPVRIFHAHGASITKDWKLPIKLVCKACLPTNMTHHFSCGVEAAKCYFGQKVVDENDYVLIPNAIDVDRFIYNPKIRNKIRKENNLENKHVVGHVGRFMAQKNHTFLMDVFAEVLKIDSQAHLVLLGDGELMDEIKRKTADLGISEHVTFVGNVGNANEWYQAFNNCLMRKIQERKPEFDLITMHDCWLYYICLGIGGKIISDKNAYIQYRQHGNNVIGAKRISIRKKIQMICQQNGSPRAKMIDEIIRLYGQDMKKEMLSKYKTFASYPKSIKAKNYFFKQSTENVFSTRELQKAKLRILFGSL